MRSGEVYVVDFGWPLGSEAGFQRPAVVVTDDGLLASLTSTFQVVPFTSTVRDWPLDVATEWGEAQVHLVTTVSANAVVGAAVGHVGPTTLRSLRELLFDLFGME